MSSGGVGEVRELQGELTFLAAEAATRGLIEPLGTPRWVALDLRHVDRVEPGAAALIADLIVNLRETGRELVLSGAGAFPSAVAQVDDSLRVAGCDPGQTFPDIDLAREWCEDRILALDLTRDSIGGSTELADHELLRGVDAAGLAVLQSELRRVCYVPGTRIVRRGDAADRLFLIMSGRLSVTTPSID